jgi:hypothetical protein
MNKDSILFLTKDALCKDYLPIYGNKFWRGKTPNMDELAAKGTVYNNFFSAAPSSSMSYLSMFTRKYPYQQDIRAYVTLPKPYQGITLFDEAYDMGFECHVIWDATWEKMAYGYTQCYGKNTTIHDLDEIKQPVGSHYLHEGKLERSKEKEEMAFEKVRSEVEKITSSDKKVFIWCHLPHVLNGRISYCDDIDLYDRYIGMFRTYFKDENIFLSADHGNMNGLKGKIGYGFDVYDKNIRIPFISPRINDMKECNIQVSNINVFELIFKHQIIESPITFSDSTYYAQPNRKLAVVHGKYRYIYNKKTKFEEFYDVEWDPYQQFNLVSDTIYDVDRKVSSPAREYYFYPDWDKLPAIIEMLRNAKDSIWREPSKMQAFMSRMKQNIFIKKYFKHFKHLIKK